MPGEEQRREGRQHHHGQGQEREDRRRVREGDQGEQGGGEEGQQPAGGVGQLVEHRPPRGTAEPKPRGAGPHAPPPTQHAAGDPARTRPRAAARAAAPPPATTNRGTQPRHAVFRTPAETSRRSTAPSRSRRSSPPTHSIVPASPLKRMRLSRARAAQGKNISASRPGYSTRRAAGSSTSYPVWSNRPGQACTASGRPALSRRRQ